RHRPRARPGRPARPGQAAPGPRRPVAGRHPALGAHRHRAGPPVRVLLPRPRPGGRADRVGRPDRLRPDPLREPVRRPAAAPVDRAGPRRTAPGGDPRRADHRARPGGAPPHVGHRRGAARLRRDDPARQPRDGRGRAALRPGGAARRRADRGPRHPRGTGQAGRVRPAGDVPRGLSRTGRAAGGAGRGRARTGGRRPRRRRGPRGTAPGRQRRSRTGRRRRHRDPQRTGRAGGRVRRAHRTPAGTGELMTTVYRPGPRAFGQMLICELKMVVRDTAGLVVPVGLPMLILVMNASSAGTQVVGNGRTALDVFVLPLVFTLVVATTGIVNMPSFLAYYRRAGILRRLGVTPASPLMVLVAQAAVGIAQIAVGVAAAWVLAVALFGANPPARVGVTLGVLALAVAAMYAVGLIVAALAPTPNSAVA